MSEKTRSKKLTTEQIHRQGFALVARLPNEVVGYLKGFPSWKSVLRNLLKDDEIRRSFADSFQDYPGGPMDSGNSVGALLGMIFKSRPELAELAECSISPKGRVRFSSKTKRS